MNERVEAIGWRDALAPTLSLFASASTLICCALPALLVTLGMGATLAGLVSAAPWLVALSAHKTLVFAVSGGLTAFAGVMLWRARNAPCPPDARQAAACQRLRRWSWAVWAAAAGVWLIGFFFAFLAADLFL
jgi:hypothetical protein